MINQLTSFRFLVAFAVFLFHAKIHLGIGTGITIFDNFLLNSATFMSGFFVLSGYIMYKIYNNTDYTKIDNVKLYYKKRFAKIYPTYALATILTTIAFFMLSIISMNFKEIGLFLLNDLFLTQSLQVSFFSLGTNGATWSISVEAFFYLLFPFVMIHIKNIKTSHFIIIVSLYSVIININTLFIGSNSSYHAYSNPIYRFNEFLMGIAFCKLNEEGVLQKLPKILKNIKFIFLLIFLLTAVSLSRGKFQYIGLSFPIIILFGFLIYSFEISNSKILQNKLLFKSREISYSFFLFQSISIVTAKYLMVSFNLPLSFTIIFCFCLNYILALLVYSIFEEPIRKQILYIKPL
jgi:peptidoglycan/LPS O-acetylase OafA/YrhL